VEERERECADQSVCGMDANGIVPSPKSRVDFPSSPLLLLPSPSSTLSTKMVAAECPSTIAI
jgi:hypothetical protein